MLRNLNELWKFRALIWALVCRHLNARYRGSVLGFLWSFLNPLCLIAVYALVFKYYIRFDHVENYTLFLFAGLLPWIWFSSGILEATAAISGGGSLVTKAMFPAHILPVVSVCTNLVNFIFAIPLLIVFMLYSGVFPGEALVLLPAILFLELIFIAGLAYALSALNVYFRDTQHILGNLITFWFFLCPILYPLDVIPDKFKFTVFLNPIAIFTMMYQKVFLENALPELSYWGITALFAVVTFVVGNLIFNRYRDGFAELV